MRLTIPSGYIGVIHSKSGLAMEGTIAVSSIIDVDYRGEIKLLMHNITGTNYNVLKENPIAQMVVYHVDRLCLNYHTGGSTYQKADLQEATKALVK